MTPPLRQIAKAIGRHFGGVTPSQIQGRRKTRSTSLARAVTLYVARAEFGMSYPELGRLVGVQIGAAHYAVNRVVEAIVAGDPQIILAVRAGEMAASGMRNTAEAAE